MDNDDFNRFRQSCQTASDLADWLYQVSDADAATTRRIQAELRDEIRRIKVYGEELTRYAE